jgi:hypothetical protein
MAGTLVEIAQKTGISCSSARRIKNGDRVPCWAPEAGWVKIVPTTGTTHEDAARRQRAAAATAGSAIEVANQYGKAEAWVYRARKRFPGLVPA